MVDASGNVLYYLNDHLGSARAVVDESGGLVDAYNSYFAFGESADEIISSENSYKYTGKPYDTDGGWDCYYYGARYYDATLGSFLAVDPLNGKYPGISPFVYTANNPLKFVDPAGDSIALAIDHSAAKGFGHAFLFVGGNKSWTAFSYERADPSGGVFGVPGFAEIPDLPKVTLQDILNRNTPIQGFTADEAIVIPASQAQDAAALSKANEIKSNPPDYNLTSCNCLDNAIVVANAGGANLKGGLIPNAYFNKNRSKGINLSSELHEMQQATREAQLRAAREMLKQATTNQQ